MKISHYAVNNENLKPYIDYYYTLKSDHPDTSIQYLVFPHLNTPVCFLKDTNVEFSFFETRYHFSAINSLSTIAWGMFTHPIKINISGPVNKFCIVFKPLGLNHFIKESFDSAVSKCGHTFTAWNGDDYETLLSHILTTDNVETGILLLERFLLNKFVDINQKDFLTDCVSHLSNIEQNLGIDEICKLENISARTFRRIFKKNLGTSPVEFKKIARFRHSLDNGIISRNLSINLTELGLRSNFYDQSHFIKVYHQMTGKNPMIFFNVIEKKAHDNFIIQLLN